MESTITVNNHDTSKATNCNKVVHHHGTEDHNLKLSTLKPLEAANCSNAVDHQSKLPTFTLEDCNASMLLQITKKLAHAQGSCHHHQEEGTPRLLHLHELNKANMKLLTYKKLFITEEATFKLLMPLIEATHLSSNICHQWITSAALHVWEISKGAAHV
ncbi:hypothetical protein Dimus_011327 [Dionaea muscipula]